ncbi:MAG: DUF6157 family protein [Devosia sp.]|nr:DUF6157 family protein [Devosia sp.]
MESVDYFDTFIAVAPDSIAEARVVPPEKGAGPTVAGLTYAMIATSPYGYTSGDVIFAIWADRKGLPEAEREAAQRAFYSRGQACLRSSDLGKRYGWGIHSDANGRIALYALGTAEYESFASGVNPLDGSQIRVVRAMRSAH